MRWLLLVLVCLVVLAQANALSEPSSFARAVDSEGHLTSTTTTCTSDRMCKSSQYCCTSVNGCGDYCRYYTCCDQNRLAAGAIVGIVFGTLSAIAILIFVCIWCCCPAALRNCTWGGYRRRNQATHTVAIVQPVVVAPVNAYGYAQMPGGQGPAMASPHPQQQQAYYAYAPQPQPQQGYAGEQMYPMQGQPQHQYGAPGGAAPQYYGQPAAGYGYASPPPAVHAGSANYSG